jgi:hypothetical protein
LGVFSVWMKIVRLLLGDSGVCEAACCWCARTVGRRRVSEGVSVGSRAALETLRTAPNVAGLMVRVQDSTVGVARRVRKSVRRNMVVDVVPRDIVDAMKKSWRLIIISAAEDPDAIGVT